MDADIRLLTKYATNTTEFQNSEIFTAYEIIVTQKIKILVRKPMKPLGESSLARQQKVATQVPKGAASCYAMLVTQYPGAVVIVAEK